MNFFRDPLWNCMCSAVFLKIKKGKIMKTFLISLLILASTQSYAAETYTLTCANDDIYTDMGTATLNLTAKIKVNGKNNYVITSGKLEFLIDNKALSSYWTEQNVKLNRVANDPNYKPRTYKGYTKFPSISKEFSGNVDLLLPHKELYSGEENITAVFIMSEVEDHWGDTLGLDCKLN